MLFLFVGAERYHHRRTRNLDLPSGRPETRSRQSPRHVAVLEPGRVDCQREAVSSPRQTLQRPQGRSGGLRRTFEQDRASGGVVEAPAAQRRGSAAQERTFLDGHDGDATARQLDNVSERRPAEAPLDLAPFVRLERVAERAASRQGVPFSGRPGSGVDEAWRPAGRGLSLDHQLLHSGPDA